MKDYDFKKLSPDEFEELARQLLNKHYNRIKNADYIQFLGTPKGKDAGIDLYHSTKENDFEIIVQVKHYAGSKITNLMNSLLGTKKQSAISELNKVKKIKPKKYVIVTSLKVSLADKQKIKREFKPYISELKDIIDYKVLNNLLEDFPEIEQNFVKLYFTSAEVMKKIIHGDNIGHGEFFKTKIENKIKIYVDTGIFKEAERSLLGKRVLIITGEPGSGKSTLAEILVYKFLMQGYQLGYIINDINQADKIWNDSYQIFYYDDFLGQNFYEMEFAQKEERPLNNFIQKVGESPNKLFVLTTRTIIYNHARDNSERFHDVRKHSSKLQIEVTDLKIEDKIRMIKNHLDFKDVPTEFKNEFTNYELNQIAGHSNFYPRIIDFVTDALSLKYVADENTTLYSYAMYTLENPIEIWRMCYEKQITEAERIFINTLFSLENLIVNSKLQIAFEKRIDFEYRNQNKKVNTWVSFEDCYRSLNEAFILTVYDYKGDVHISFINPSVADFLLSYLPKYKLEVKSILHSAYYIEQFFFRFRFEGDKIATQHIKISLPSEFYGVIKKNEVAFKSIYTFGYKTDIDNYIAIYQILILVMYFRDHKDLDKDLNEILHPIDFYSIEKVHFNNLINLLIFFKQRPLLFEFVKNRWSELIYVLIEKSYTIQNLNRVFGLFKLYNQSVQDFISLDTNMYQVKSIIDIYRKDEIEDAIKDLKNSALSIEDVYTCHQQLQSMLYEDYKLNNIETMTTEIPGWDLIDWHQVVKQNQNENYYKLIDSHKIDTAYIENED